MASDLASIASPAAIEHLRWALTPEVGPILFQRIVERFGSAQAALSTGAAQLQTVEGIGPATAETIARGREGVNVQSEIMLAAEHGVRVLCMDDDEYPALLKHIADPPICLYVKGELKPTDGVAVAIVGARRCSSYGLEQAHRFGYQLAQRGMAIISGLARGIDGESHKGALSAGGRTLAVLGNGLANIYPPEHKELAERIAESGAVISALPMTTTPEAKNFLPRNRVIAGLSLGVVVIEAAQRSGALSTAARACEYNREVFALPGRVDVDSSRGTNALIRDQHAKLITCADDVLDELGDVGEALRQPAGTTEQKEEQPSLLNGGPDLSDEERALIEQLDHDEKSIEVLVEATGLPTPKVTATLIALQLKGLARQLPGNIFVRPGIK